MKTVNRMRTAMLAVVAMLVVGVVAVLACGPAEAPEPQSRGAEDAAGSVSAVATEAPFVLQQSDDGGRDGQKGDGGDEPDPTATPYPDDCKRKVNFGTGEWEIVCPPPGSRKIDHNLRREYNNLMEEKATRQARGEPVRVIEHSVTIEVSTHADVDAVADFLEARTTNPIKRTKDDDGGGRVGGVLSIELLPPVAEMDGVEKVQFDDIAVPASQMRQSGTPTPTMTALERVRVDQWHDAGVTGSGVEVAVIDFDFRNFRTRIADPAVVNADPNQPDVHFFCYNAAGVATEDDFTFCETSPVSPLNPGLRPHGTDVVAALRENVPDATLYISNASSVRQLEQAVDWLTLRDADDSASDVDYDRLGNNHFDVKVINHSQTYVWDGPGDGTSPFVTRNNRSSLNIVNDAVGRGVSWFNAAGNQRKSTWFTHHPVFHDLDGSLSYFGTTGGQRGCNAFTVDSSNGYAIQTRWSGSWSGADIDLDLELYDQTVVPVKRVGLSMDPQSGGSSHYPREVLRFPAGTLNAGRHCVAVTKDPGDPNDPNDSGEDVPDWIQIQVHKGSGDFARRTVQSSISNPAESVNPGMLAVGAAKITSSSSLALQDFSARGPLPLTGSPVKPDVVGLNTDLAGTSFSSPRVAGAAALIVQGGGDGASPTRVAGALREHAEHPAGFPFPDQDWGHGFSKLPSMDAPAVVSVSHDPCSGSAPLRVDYSHPAVGTYPMAFQFEAKQAGVSGTAAGSYETTHIGTVRSNPRDVYVDTSTDRGSYDVTAKACTEEGHCGPSSSPPVRFTTTPKVCQVRWFRAVPGDEKVTLWWNPDPDATGYKVELVGGSSFSVSGTEHVVDGLVNGGLYEYRVQVLGAGGPSEWTSPRRVTPEESTSRPPTPTNLRVGSNISRRYPGLGLRWHSPLGSYLYEVKVKGGGADDWQRLSFQPSGWDSEYSARFFGAHERVEDSFVLVGDAIIAGLIPGTEYHFAVRAARERDTGSGEPLYRSPWSKPITLTTPGVRPVDAPGEATAPTLKAPPEDLMAEVDGMTVDLSWTAATNPNYVEQVVRRRDLSVSPLVWTEIDVGLEDTSYADTGLTSGKTYRYRVRAYKDRANNKYGEQVGGYVDAVIP